jgi:hypothetical protein
MIMTVENMSTLVLPKGTARALRDLTGEPRPDVALLLVLRDALAYRLGQIETDLRAFEASTGCLLTSTANAGSPKTAMRTTTGRPNGITWNGKPWSPRGVAWRTCTVG